MRSANAVKQDLLFLDKLAEDCESDSLCELALLDKCILTRIVRKMFSAVSSQMPEKVHIDALCERIYEYGKDNTVKCGVAFPDSVLARFDGGRLVFVKDERKKKNEKEEFCLPLSEGELFFKENPYSLYITFDVLEFEENIYKKVTTDYLYFATIPSALCVRNRREGDRIYSGKMHKSIKKLFALSDINGEERNLLPLVCDGGKILCIPSAAVSDDCRTESNECICVTLYKKINLIKE